MKNTFLTNQGGNKIRGTKEKGDHAALNISKRMNRTPFSGQIEKSSISYKKALAKQNAEKRRTIKYKISNQATQ